MFPCGRLPVYGGGGQTCKSFTPSQKHTHSYGAANYRREMRCLQKETRGTKGKAQRNNRAHDRLNISAIELFCHESTSKGKRAFASPSLAVVSHSPVKQRWQNGKTGVRVDHPKTTMESSN